MNASSGTSLIDEARTQSSLGDAPLPLLDRAERLILGSRLSLALAALCLLVVAFGMRFLLPAQRGVAELVAGVSAALVAVPYSSRRGRACVTRACTASPTGSWRWP